MYRLRVIPIFLPPLRARPLDVGLLMQKLIEELNDKGGRHITTISPAALARLEAYPWPGNVRELRNALEYAYVIGEGPVLVPGDLPAEVTEPETSLDPIDTPATPSLSEAEKAEIHRALERVDGHRERAAEILGISRVTLWRRMRALGMQIDA